MLRIGGEIPGPFYDTTHIRENVVAARAIFAGADPLKRFADHIGLRPAELPRVSRKPCRERFRQLHGDCFHDGMVLQFCRLSNTRLLRLIGQPLLQASADSFEPLPCAPSSDRASDSGKPVGRGNDDLILQDKWDFLRVRRVQSKSLEMRPVRAATLNARKRSAAFA